MHTRDDAQDLRARSTAASATLGPKDLPLTANLYYYDFQNIADALVARREVCRWARANSSPMWRCKPVRKARRRTTFSERSSRSIFGMQVGFYPMSNVLLTAAFDSIPLEDRHGHAAGRHYV